MSTSKRYLPTFNVLRVTCCAPYCVHCAPWSVYAPVLYISDHPPRRGRAGAEGTLHSPSPRCCFPPSRWQCGKWAAFSQRSFLFFFSFFLSIMQTTTLNLISSTRPKGVGGGTCTSWEEMKLKNSYSNCLTSELKSSCCSTKQCRHITWMLQSDGSFSIIEYLVQSPTLWIWGWKVQSKRLLNPP